jgi:hypothetical protein
MKQLTKYTKFFVLIGIIATIVGYLFLFFETNRLYNTKSELVGEIETKKKEIDSLGMEKRKLIEEIKRQKRIKADAFMQMAISKDISTQNSAKGLIKESGEPISKYFTVSKQKDYNQAKQYELEGFNALVNKNVETAIELFTKSENSYNNYHQVYEIAKYLKENKKKLDNPQSEFWDEAYKKIIAEFSWGMTNEIKEKINKQLEK